jgi:hypothetical protein
MAVALIIGGADHVIEDAVAAMRLFEPDAFMLLNDMISRWPMRCDYALTLHPEKISDWLRLRQQKGLSRPGEVWCHKSGPLIDRYTRDWSGSSGLFAVKVALVELKFDGIVLAGVPMQSSSNHFVRQEPWASAASFQNGWRTRYPEIKDSVRSMSGWTKDLLLYPDEQWLLSINANPPDPERIAPMENFNGEV